MSDLEREQILQTHWSPVLQKAQETAHAVPIRQERASAPAQKTAGTDEGWERMIDNKLIEWGRDPSQLDEEGTVSPSKQTIQFAIFFAGMLRNTGMPAPTRVVPDAHGGIVFEFHEKDLNVTFRLSADISLEYCAFENCRLVQRQKLASPFVPSE
jgi:hypothetical protein